MYGTYQRLLKKVKTACSMLLLVNSVGSSSDTKWSTFFGSEQFLNNVWYQELQNQTPDEQEAWNSEHPDLTETFCKYEGDYNFKQKCN